MAGSRALTWTLAGAILFGVLVVVGGCFALLKLSSDINRDFASAAATLETERQKAKRLRLPLTAEELFPNRPIPNELNAGPKLASILSEIRQRTPTDGPARKAIGDLTTGTAGSSVVEQLRKDLKALKPLLDQVTRLVKRPHCDFGKDYGKGVMVKFPEMADVKHVAILLTALARIEARDGNEEEATAAFFAAFRLADCAGQEPAMIGLLVQIACRTIAYDALRRMLRERGGDPTAVTIAKSVLHMVQEPVDPLHAFRGEIVMGVSTIRNLGNLSEISDFSGSETPDSLRRPVNTEMKRAWEAKFLAFWNRVFGSLASNRLDLVEVREVMNRETARERSGRRVLDLLNAILLPVSDQAALATMRERAQAAVSQAMVEVLRFRNRNGKFPDTLDDLDSNLVDPFDQQPLRYRNHGARFTIHSIDIDLKDDGGKARPRGAGNSTPGDLVASFP